jgi:sensor histidine kinase YesM
MHYPWDYMENSSPLDVAPRPSRTWLSTLYTAALCLGVAVFLWLLGASHSFPATLGVSLCIGLSINSTFMLFRERGERFAHPMVVAMLLTGVGLGIGLLLGGTLVLGRPLYFFSDDYSSIVIGIFFGIVGFTIISTRERLADAREEVANLRAEQLAQQREMLETELKLLQAQIEPHFLFNTLSNVVGLVRSDPEAAERTLLNLSTLLRSSLRRTRADAVSLGEELEIVRAYLAIQSIRMPDRLEYTIDVADDPDLMNWPLPPLIIQPLVENAIRHGIEPAEGGGTVSIGASLDNAGLRIVVADTGLGIREAGSGGEGTGLSNVRSRLHRLYGEGAELGFRDNSPSGVRVEIRIPEQVS